MKASLSGTSTKIRKKGEHGRIQLAGRIKVDGLEMESIIR
jgi:hypothetical protein